MSHDLELGAVGWRHEQWIDQFYPDTLPAEWQLTYYSNEFSCVLVPDPDWSEQEPDQVATWLEDVHENFSFFFELSVDEPPQADPARLERLLALAEPLAGRIGGVVVRLPRASQHGPPRAPALIEGLGAHFPVHVDAPWVLDASWRDTLSAAGAAGLCWRAQGTEPRQGCAVGLLAGDEGAGDRRWLGELIQRFVRQAGGVGNLALFLEGSPPRIQTLQDARVIVDLLAP